MFDEWTKTVFHLLEASIRECHLIQIHVFFLIPEMDISKMEIILAP